jgi:hypothetical protein
VTDFKNPMFRQMHAEAYAKYLERVRESWKREYDERMFPSTTKESSEGERAATSPLGGKVW